MPARGLVLRIQDDFAGRIFPIASVPSISWLAAIRENDPPMGSRRAAWIPAESYEEETGLVWLAERLQPSLDGHGIALLRDPTLPQNLAGCELAIIAAHGGLLPEKPFIQRISAGEKLV